MYSLKNLATKNPTQISGAVMGVVNVPIVAGWWTLAGPAVAAVNIALVGVLGLFVAATTTNTAKLNELDAGS